MGSPEGLPGTPVPKAAVTQFADTVTLASALVAVLTFIVGTELPPAWTVIRHASVAVAALFGLLCMLRWVQLERRDRAVRELDAERSDYRMHIDAGTSGSAVARSFRDWSAHTFELLYGSDVAFWLFGRRHIAIRLPVSEETAVATLSPDLNRYRELTCLESSTYRELHGYSEMAHRYLLLEPTNPKSEDRLGYHLVRLDDRDGHHVACAGVCTWKDNHATSHVLEYELYQTFRTWNGQRFLRVEDARAELPLRTAAGADARVGLYRGVHASCRPLLSVQALVLTRSPESGSPWGVLMWKRSQNVAIRRGWYQFPPSGAFETLNLSDTSLSVDITAQCSVKVALLREFAEEVLGDRGLEDVRAMSLAEFYKRSSVRKINDAFTQGVAKSRYLGIVIDPFAFRAEFTFLVVIDAVWDWKAGREGVEALAVRTLPTLREAFADRAVDINPGSAAMLAMALQCGALKDYGVDDDLAQALLAEPQYQGAA